MTPRLLLCGYLQQRLRQCADELISFFFLFFAEMAGWVWV